MEIFEIHITGDESIHSVAQTFGYKTIAVDLLDPLGKKMRTEHMTSVILKATDYLSCLITASRMFVKLSKKGVNVERFKIECPYYEHYVDRSLYMESHFESEEMKLPTSKNQRKTTLLATDRTYNQAQYDDFRHRYQGKDIELCLIDSNIEQDKDWFDAYSHIESQQ